MQDRNNIQNNKNQVAEKDANKQKSSDTGSKQRTEGQPDRDRQSSDRNR